MDVFDTKGKKTQKKVTLDKVVFDSEVNEQLLSMAVHVFLMNQREANAHSKDRSEVRGGGKKPWRQKGTGRARHGSTRSPIWTGGGVTFGPSNERNFKKKLNKKVKLKALRNAFTQKNKSGDVIIIEDFKPTKTKDVEALVKNLKLEGKVTFIQLEEDGLNRFGSNIANVNVLRVGEVNIYDVLNNNNLVILEGALTEISSRWGEDSGTVKQQNSKSTKDKDTKAVEKQSSKKTTKKKNTKK